MIIETRTSVYKVEQENKRFRVTKTAILPGHDSGVGIGKSEVGDYIKITPEGLSLYLNDMAIPVLKTSPIKL